ncbi:hypothetical protein [Streptomyces swartbergensis]|uniref:hypothetical protein n=1 Tax=Streptomyces swartbergensis TaxID=487165 RepID=UPI0038138483
MRVKPWREDAQPEWPDVAAATGELLADDRARDRRATQVFSGGDVQVPGTRPSAGTELTEILRGIPRQSEGEADSFAAGPGTRPSVRDPWQEDADPVGHVRAGTLAAHAHDPHEVTVQLDAVQLGDGFVRQVEEGTGAGSGTTGDRPVFVDESGRRSRRFRRIGIAVALACGVYAVVIVATLLSGNSNAPWLPVPGQKEGRPAGQVDTPPQPTESAPAGDTGATAPGSAPATEEATAPAPGPGALQPAASASPGRSGTAARPSPTATPTTPAAPGKGVTDPTPTEPADPPTTPATDPTPTVEPTPEPTEPTGAGDSGGTDTVAEGPPETPPAVQPPVAQPPAA